MRIPRPNAEHIRSIFRAFEPVPPWARYSNGGSLLSPGGEMSLGRGPDFGELRHADGGLGFPRAAENQTVTRQTDQTG